jgi:hypothetical protein
MSGSQRLFFTAETNAAEQHSRGRPSEKAAPPMALRLYPDIIAALDEWIEEQPDPKPNRPEAIRELLRIALGILPDTVQVHLLQDDSRP